MKILAIGDVVGTPGLEYLSSKLWGIRNSLNIDFCVVNGENATDISGVSRNDALKIFDAGADVITLGNHTWGRRDLYELLDENESIIRPANYPAGAPGNGYTIAKVSGYRVLCMNLIGTVNLPAEDCPFRTADAILDRENGNYDVALVDIHAEATSEKIAMGRYLDGRVSAVFGTHTHVTTADEQILPNGTAYITDLGMTGPTNGVLGVSYDIIISKFLTHMPHRFKVAEGECKANGILLDVDESTGRARSIKRITF